MNGFPVRETICVARRVVAARMLMCARCAIATGIAVAPLAIAQNTSATHRPDVGGVVVVQPGAPGEPTKPLPATTHAKLPPISRADVEFMQGMIMHHSQAVEMTALIQSHTENKDVRAIGAKISSSQADEIRMMQRWLAARGQALSMEKSSGPEMPGMPEMDMSGKAMTGAPGMGLMPGMLSPEQMEALKRARDAEFDRLFLSGMIQHHGGAVVMVKDLFNSAGSGQDAEIFDFATDVDNSQRAEIRIMQRVLEELH
jgi:uncharacterized protein (DUF305 family)